VVLAGKLKLRPAGQLVAAGNFEALRGVALIVLALEHKFGVVHVRNLDFGGFVAASDVPLVVAMAELQHCDTIQHGASGFLDVPPQGLERRVSAIKPVSIIAQRNHARHG
jgi:hypothetical protein